MYRTWLIPYLEGTLDAEQRRQVESRLAEDPDLAAEMESLRRAEPRLRRAVANLRQTEGTVAPRPAPLWPRLRERLDPRAQRPARGPVFGWLGGACAAGAALLAVLTLMPRTHPPLRDKQLVRDLKHAPRVVFHRDNAAGTMVVAKLQKRAARVALAKRAVNPHVAALMAKAGPLPVALPVVRPAAPPLPPVLIAGQLPKPAAVPFAPKLPMPVAPPFQMAQALPAPKHSPLRDLTGEADSLPVLDKPTPPAPRHSSVHMNGNVYGMIGGRAAAKSAFTPAPPAPEQHGANRDGLMQNAPSATAGASVAAGGVTPQVQTFAETSVPVAGAALTQRQRLEQTVTPPLYGTPAGAQELQRLLQSARSDGTLDALAGQIEQETVDAGRADAQEAVRGRLLAAIYEANADLNRALAERRRVALLATAAGEDWFELAQTEEQLGNVASAQRAYAQALRAGGASLSAAHRAVAHQNLP